jgi:Mg-chelatase subunit ChlD
MRGSFFGEAGGKGGTPGSRDKLRIRILLDRKLYAGQGPSGETETYTLEELAKYLHSLGDLVVYTDIGVFTAREASKLVLSGGVRELLVKGTVIKVTGSGAIASEPLSIPGIGEAELTYSHRELTMVKMADLLSSMGIETSKEYHEFLRDPVNAAVRAVKVVEEKRSSPIYRRLKSALLNLLDVVSDIMLMREGNDIDALTNRLVRYSRSGEFEEVTDHQRHKLHLTRTLLRAHVGVLRPVYKVFIETGRHYVLVMDRSGSMGEIYRGATKKAFAALIALLIAKADPEAKFSLAVFDSSAKILARKRDPGEVADLIVEAVPAGGTSYFSGLAAAEKLLEDGDVLVVIGDFIDGSPIPRKLGESIKRKASKSILVPVGNADYSYALYIAKILGGEVYIYRNGKLVLLRYL